MRQEMAPLQRVSRECGKFVMVFLTAKQHLPRRSPWRWLLEKLMPVSVAYRPERHYMRGPGPKYRERHAESLAPPRSH